MKLNMELLHKLDISLLDDKIRTLTKKNERLEK